MERVPLTVAGAAADLHRIPYLPGFAGSLLRLCSFMYVIMAQTPLSRNILKYDNEYVIIFFFYWKDNTFVLLHHFIKKTQKTPPREIETAWAKLKDFLERHGE